MLKAVASNASKLGMFVLLIVGLSAKASELIVRTAKFTKVVRRVLRKACVSIVIILDASSIDAREVQFKNVDTGSAEMAAFTVAVVKPEQPLNTPVPIEVMVEGTTILVSPEQFSKKLLGSAAHWSGIVMEVRPEHPNSTLTPSVRGNMPLEPLLGNVTEVRPVHPPKAWSPISVVVTEGNAIEVRPVHP